jgi:peptide/nickel transport system substrate-binding protein
MIPVARRSLIGGAFAVALANPPRARAAEGLLRFGLSAYPPNFRPWDNTGASAGTVKLLLFRGLTGYDSNGALRGELAESWSTDETGAWVFKLRANAQFQNGEPVTADDVKWTIEQIAGEKSTAYLRSQFQQIASIEVQDARTVRLVTKTRQATLPLWFANNAGIVWRKSDPADPVGAGPYMLAARERGVAVELAAFGGYYKPGLPKLPRLRFVAYADETLRVAALQAGDVDIIEYVPWQSMQAVEQDPHLKLAVTEGAAFMDIVFNGSRPPFSDPRVRRAVAHAIRREEIVQAVFFGRGRSLAGVPITEGTPYYDATLAHGWAYDPARSKSLLAEAGYANGFSTTLLATAQYGMHKDTAQIVQQHLAEIGIQCALSLPDWSTRITLGTRGQYDFAIHGVAADNNDPDGLTGVMDTSLSPSHARSFQLDAPRTVAAMARGRAEYDQAARVQIYRDMQVAALEEVPLVGLAWRSQGYGMTSKVGGFTNLPGALSIASGSTLEETTLA